MENTLENKAKFFAQYSLQGVLVNGMGNKGLLTFIDLSYVSNGILAGYLQLKPLSSITDEDAVQVAGIVGYRNVITDMRKKSELIKLTKEAIESHVLTYKIVDYLRSKGYALPYMGLSVEKQIEYGWIKLS